MRSWTPDVPAQFTSCSHRPRVAADPEKMTLEEMVWQIPMAVSRPAWLYS